MKSKRTAAALVLALVMAAHAAPRAEIIDRVLAVVNGAVILQSDSRAVLRLGLMEMPAGPEPLRQVLNRLIDRRLVLIEVRRSGTPDPAAAAVESEAAEVRSRFGSDEELARALAEVGLTWEQVRSFIIDDLRMAAYLQQRFGASVQPADAEIVEFYRTHPDQFTRGGELQPFSAVADEARTRVTEERRAATIRDWIAGLRGRADVTIPAIVRPTGAQENSNRRSGGQEADRSFDDDQEIRRSGDQEVRRSGAGRVLITNRAERSGSSVGE